MLKFVLLSALLGASLAMNVVEDAAEGANLSERHASCGLDGCTQTDECKKPSKAEGFCTKSPDACENAKENFYIANNAQCKHGCQCVMKCRSNGDCDENGGYCVRRDQTCRWGYTKRDCGCKTKNKCSCCVPHAKAHKLPCW